MSLTLTYDAGLSRVRAALTGLVDAATFRLERSTDQVRWSTVRGGTALAPASGVASLDDYEFAADVQNFYRLRGPVIFDDYGRTVAAGSLGTAPSGQTYTLSGGDTALFLVTGGKARIPTATINSIDLATADAGSPTQVLQVEETLPVVPAGAGITLRAFARYTDASNYYQAVVTVAVGGAATLQLFRNVAGVGASISSSVAVGTHAAGNTWLIRMSAVGSAIAAKAWRTVDPEPADWQVTGTDATLTTGNRAGYGCRRETSNTNGTVNVDFDNFVVSTPEATVFTANITPSLGGVVWLKSVARPFLNRPVVVQDFSDVSRDARAGVFGVVGRSAPIAVSDVRGSQQFNLMVLTETLAEARDFDLMLASGDTLFIHVPAAEMVPGGYVTVGQTTATRTGRRSVRRVFTLPCMVVAAPGPEVVGVTYTWQGVVNDYATWSALLAAFGTWSDVLDNVGSAEDVIVP